MSLTNSYTSTGAKFFHHEEAMRKLRNGQGQPIVTHLMPTDICQHTCAFCSVQTRDGAVLGLYEMLDYLDILLKYGLKAVIISGGGNPLLYHSAGHDFNDLIEGIHERGLEIGLITNGMPLREVDGRMTWKGVYPWTLDRLTWVRISMSGLDHAENEVYVPDLAPNTRLGFSYILHDVYDEPLDKNHGKVSTEADLISKGPHKVVKAEERIPELTEHIAAITQAYHPAYVRLLPNCLEPSKIPERCEQLQEMANLIDPDVAFVQYKPPRPPNACYLGYVHPVLNSDGYVYPCDSCVLNETADHKFASPWRVCHWSDVAKLYEEPIRSLVNPKELCPGCVFPRSNEILEGVAKGEIEPAPSSEPPDHVNFI